MKIGQKGSHLSICVLVVMVAVARPSQRKMHCLIDKLRRLAITFFFVGNEQMPVCATDTIVDFLVVCKRKFKWTMWKNVWVHCVHPFSMWNQVLHGGKFFGCLGWLCKVASASQGFCGLSSVAFNPTLLIREIEFDIAWMLNVETHEELPILKAFLMKLHCLVEVHLCQFPFAPVSIWWFVSHKK